MLNVLNMVTHRLAGFGWLPVPYRLKHLAVMAKCGM
jgi:hypothetical protein